MKKQKDIEKDQYKLLKEQRNDGIDGNREDDVKAEDEDMSGESNITKNFDAVLKDIKNNRRTAKSISVKS